MPGHAPLLVGDVAQRDVHPAAVHPVEGLGAVPYRINLLMGGSLGEVDPDCTRFAERESHLFCQHDIGPDPDGHQDHVRLRLAVVRGQTEAMVPALRNSPNFRVRDEIDLVPTEFLENDSRKLRIPAVHREFPPMEDLGLQVEVSQRLGHFHPDETGSDNDRLATGNLAEPCLDPDRVGKLLQREDPLELLPGNSGHQRHCPGSQDENIVGKPFPAGQTDLASLLIHFLDADVGPHTHACFPEFFRGPRNQLLRFLDYISDVIGHRSSGDRHLGSLLDHGDQKRRIPPPRLGSRGSASRPRPYNHNLFSHTPFLSSGRRNSRLVLKITLSPFPSDGIQDHSRSNHHQTEELPHAEGAQNKPELNIRLPEKLDKETDDAVTRDVDGKEGAGE